MENITTHYCMTNLNLPHKGIPFACVIVTISASFIESLAVCMRTHAGWMMTKPRTADMPSTWSIIARQHNSFQIAPLSLIHSELQQQSSCSGNFKIQHNTWKPCVDVYCEITGMKLFQIQLAWLINKENGKWKWRLNRRVCFHFPQHLGHIQIPSKER